MAPDVGDALDDADIELDDVRNRLRALLGAEEQPLIKLRRVTAGSVLNLALLAIATYTLIAVFGDLDVQELADELPRRQLVVAGPRLDARPDPTRLRRR